MPGRELPGLLEVVPRLARGAEKRILQYLASTDVLLGLGLALRVVLVIFSEVQDWLAEVPYTDVDYRVFSEAAESVSLGLSPFAGRTPLLRADATRYRYTPLLAYLLLPNVWLHHAWGKLLFSVLDIAAAFVLRAWLQAFACRDKFTVQVGLCLWLFNPFCFTISTRGSGESVVVLLLYGCFAALHLKRNLPLAAALFGLAVHWRLYPVVYSLPIALGLAHARRGSGLQCLLKREVALFGAISGATFVLLATFFTALYGRDFLEGAYLYHSGRVDAQHNFSVYFYFNVLHLESPAGHFPNLARWAALPQLAACAWLGWQEGPRGPAIAPLLQTVALVAMNKVVTAQYFVWWWSMLPLALPWLAWRHWPLSRAGILWATAEVHWLLWAYLLEFRRWPVRLGVWFASWLLLAAHLLLLLELRRSARLAGG